MRRIILVFALAALLVLVVAVPAFAGAQVFKECGTFTDPQATTEFCNHGVTTPSGNRNNHSKVETEFANGETIRTKDSFHAKDPP